MPLAQSVGCATPLRWAGSPGLGTGAPLSSRGTVLPRESPARCRAHLADVVTVPGQRAAAGGAGLVLSRPLTDTRAGGDPQWRM